MLSVFCFLFFAFCYLCLLPSLLCCSTITAETNFNKRKEERGKRKKRTVYCCFYHIHHQLSHPTDFHLLPPRI
ncbi:uncharacterized protein ASCRUDRAFT_128255 [Ascoidea rubescens DSM 1968]|uniref:Secreted protein n=1 Tax=Ascoidea rubescens DSM 1968 TaxID=1344418 RepID=A0A1D2V910_9ASCO|nr:hypothetical protein ASCRUDRAFT_128255 [Ascoidea rubescens DSM 1968]ODV58151.1 hypothetical protein ASCRUDRAFT_128255 [Ascoidea rubescens DSM 1968]